MQLFRERLSEKICTRQSQKVIWDMIDTLFLATVAVEPTFVVSVSTRKHIFTAFRANSFKFFWRTVNPKPPTMPFGIVACTFSDNLSRNSYIRPRLLWEKWYANEGKYKQWRRQRFACWTLGSRLWIPDSKQVLGYLPFTWKNRKFRLESQMVRAIPFGKLIWTVIGGEANDFSTLFSLFSWCGYTLLREFSHQVKFYSFMFLHKISTSVVLCKR